MSLLMVSWKLQRVNLITEVHLTIYTAKIVMNGSVERIELPHQNWITFAVDSRIT